MQEYRDNISSANSMLSQFSDSLFISAERQQYLAENVEKYQESITSTIRNAVQTRGYLTDAEKEKIEGFVDRIKELTQEQIEVGNAKADAINQQAQMFSDSYTGDLNSYQDYAQRYIATARENRDQTIQLAEETYTEKLVWLNQQYSEEERKTDSHYQELLTQYTSDRDEAVRIASEKYGQTNAIFAEGMTKRGQDYESFAGHFKYWEDVFNANYKEYQDNIAKMNEEGVQDQGIYNARMSAYQQDLQKKQKIAYDGMVNNMSQSQQRQLGAWLNMVRDAEANGATLDRSVSQTFGKVERSITRLPNETKGTFTNVMQGAISEVDAKSPILLQRATNLSSGFLTRINNMFKIKSPSRAMKDIFKYVMLGAEKGLDSEEDNLYRETEQIAKGVLDRFSFEGLSNQLQSAIDLQNGNISASLNNSMSRNLTANINLIGSVEMDKKKVGRLVAPSVQRTFREAGAYVN